ncbi:hypothetical protein L1987_66030 [Smallanthus sonchifolius]|uniref:Uncharacterized protein n=1 Tax=Smallanthus sonchifolius TaxID=185202 RepID=A0ACB9BWB4_9ASTR|nr:hypothetical protein L1987_66030 [Smallanthus sonchifolius]
MQFKDFGHFSKPFLIFIKIFVSDPSCADYLKVLIESLFSNTGHNHHFADLFHMVLIDSRKREARQNLENHLQQMERDAEKEQANARNYKNN